MAGGLFSRLKIWDDFETLKNEALNAEFNNIINNLDAFKLGGASENVSQFLAALDPGDVGSENLPESIAEELQMLRFQINAIVGGSAWIDDPPTSLTDIGSALDSAGLLKDNRIVSGKLDSFEQPQWLRAEGSSNQVNLDATVTDFQTFINGQQVTFDTDLSFTGLSLAPAANNTALVADPNIAGADDTKLLGERNSQIPIGTIGTEISSRNGQLAGFKVNNGVDDEFFIAQVDTSATIPNLKNAFRGYFFDSAGLSVPRITINDTDVITLMRLTWIFAKNLGGTKSLDATLNQPFVQADTPSSPGSGDYWFDLNTSEWKKFTGALFEVQDAIFVGFCIQDDTNTIASRSTDLTKAYSDINTLCLSILNTNQVRSKFQSVNVNAYGNNIFFEKAYATWSMPGDLDSGESESPSTKYYVYLTVDGDMKLSTIPPHDRSEDLFGEYHPSRPYRAIGSILNDGSSDIVAAPISYGEATSQDYVDGQAGDLKDIARTELPDGWLYCDGLAVSRSTYAALFEAIGVTYGVGDGSSTFNIPDFRHRIAVGRNDVALPNGVGPFIARSVGDSFGTIESLAHSHAVDNHTHTGVAHNHQWYDHVAPGSFGAGGGAVGFTVAATNGAGQIAVDTLLGSPNDRINSSHHTNVTGAAPTGGATPNTDSQLANDTLNPSLVITKIVKF